ncbi:hypothetical protein SAMN05216266_101604 [Amycolatopsis marina]|uniref:Uncharacterized protein n=1 Tax=Amycolatopsis marina TaxID=490629 RepID=A0A1I0VYH4_9PSEU|nr:hypothetical protein [Amycolatopsis marina]SFA81505.1 hypothetical protein SAMN05216266_101604 [Amycolatopsis marina]
MKNKRRPGRPPADGYPDHDCTKAGCTVTKCPSHQCRPLSNATISKLHFIMRGALSAADALADERDGHAYYAINALGRDTSEDKLFEIRFCDGEWMLAVEADLTPFDEHAS